MVIAFQIILIIIMFFSAITAVVDNLKYDTKIVAYVVNATAIVSFIASAMWL